MQQRLHAAASTEVEKTLNIQLKHIATVSAPMIFFYYIPILIITVKKDHVTFVFIEKKIDIH